VVSPGMMHKKWYSHAEKTQELDLDGCFDVSDKIQSF
jgi:hypothetical protein